MVRRAQHYGAGVQAFLDVLRDMYGAAVPLLDAAEGHAQQ